MTDERARKVHHADQIGGDLRLVAQMLATYNDELKAQGFTDDERLDLLLHAAEILFGGSRFEGDV